MKSLLVPTSSILQFSPLQHKAFLLGSKVAAPTPSNMPKFLVSEKQNTKERWRKGGNISIVLLACNINFTHKYFNNPWPKLNQMSQTSFRRAVQCHL